MIKSSWVLEEGAKLVIKLVLEELMEEEVFAEMICLHQIFLIW